MPDIVAMLQSRSSLKLRYASDCDRLATEISRMTDKQLSVTTLKRMLGFTTIATQPRRATLDIIARYLGYDNYDRLLEFINISNENYHTGLQAFTPPTITHFSTESKPATLEIGYDPHGCVKMVQIGELTFCITQSTNPRLKPGDEMILSHVAVGKPLVIERISRGGICAWRCVLAVVSGVTSILVNY